jgi:hypothetical protein
MPAAARCGSFAQEQVCQRPRSLWTEAGGDRAQAPQPLNGTHVEGNTQAGGSRAIGVAVSHVKSSVSMRERTAATASAQTLSTGCVRPTCAGGNASCTCSPPRPEVSVEASGSGVIDAAEEHTTSIHTVTARPTPPITPGPLMPFRSDPTELKRVADSHRASAPRPCVIHLYALLDGWWCRVILISMGGGHRTRGTTSARAAPKR